MTSPASDEPIEAAVVEGHVYVESAGGAGMFMTPDAVLASLEPLRRAAEAASSDEVASPPDVG